MATVTAHWKEIAVAGLWMWSRLRVSMPSLGAAMFWRTWMYDFVKGNSATVAAATKPPV